jgi:Ser/Thr protein kinase RdoA (MazF antagonist)
LPIANRQGELFTKTTNSLFRLSPFVFGDCVNQVKSEEQAFLAAKAFAELIIAGKDVDPNALQEVIPDFHNLEFRYRQLEEALSETKLEIKGELKDLVDFYLGQYSLVEEYLEWKKILPKRLTHNDTKINNLIFSEDGSKVNAVIDLDTLMAGYVFFDFGDLVRTVACTEEESSTDWENINFDHKKYKGLSAGFAEAGKDFFTKEELDSLPFGGLMMTYIMGLRFLADYLRGNIYYTTHYPDQNLHRAKNQMILLKAMSNLKQS